MLFAREIKVKMVLKLKKSSSADQFNKWWINSSKDKFIQTNQKSRECVTLLRSRSRGRCCCCWYGNNSFCNSSPSHHKAFAWSTIVRLELYQQSVATASNGCWDRGTAELPDGSLRRVPAVVDANEIVVAVWSRFQVHFDKWYENFVVVWCTDQVATIHIVVVVVGVVLTLDFTLTICVTVNAFWKENH